MVKLKKHKFAVFDIDGTIFRSSLLIQLVERLIEREVFHSGVRDGYSQEYNNWVDRNGDYEDYIDAVVRVFRENIKGVYYGDFADVAREVVAEQSKRTYKYTRDLIANLKTKGYYLLAISHSPKTILDEFCTTLGFDKVYGMIYEIGPTDKLTGEIADEHIILNKANILKRAIAQEGLDIEDSIGVGDTEGDIPMLEMVERSICFNPNSALYKQAQVRGWEVVVERKDVVYHL
jgi:HAD superfamily hydrolase (TIGR01490 family)